MKPVTAATDLIGRQVDQQFTLRRLEQQDAAETKTSTQNAGR